MVAAPGWEDEVGGGKSIFKDAVKASDGTSGASPKQKSNRGAGAKGKAGNKKSRGASRYAEDATVAPGTGKSPGKSNATVSPGANANTFYQGAADKTQKGTMVKQQSQFGSESSASSYSDSTPDREGAHNALLPSSVSDSIFKDGTHSMPAPSPDPSP